MNDTIRKAEPLIHLIFSANENKRINVQEMSREEKTRDPVAELNGHQIYNLGLTNNLSDNVFCIKD